LQLPPPDTLERNCSKGFEKYHFSKHIQNKVLTRNSKAFTLAEVLIALVVIGIISAITLPSTIANYQEKAKVAKIKKVYATLSNAMIKVKAAGGDMDFELKDGDNDSIKQWFDTYLKPNLITTKICYYKAGCWNSGSKYLNGQIAGSSIGIGGEIITVILNDGTFLNFDVSFGTNSMGINSTDNIASLIIYTDINGSKKPNIFGKDIFVFVWVPYRGLIPAFADSTQEGIDRNCSINDMGRSCIQKYLKEF
jgi:prepilin-type N-terminal cleavage/methylation domain-containing protein